MRLTSAVLGLFLVFSLSAGRSQSLGDTTSQGATQGTSQGTTQGTAVDCTDPILGQTAQCAATQTDRSGGTQGRDTGVPALRTPQLRTTPSLYPDQVIQPNPSQLRRLSIPREPETEFEQMVADSAGQVLPLFGQSLFLLSPTTFAPINQQQVPSDYVIGPGDELQIRISGQIDGDLRVMVDRSGQIDIPHVGPISVAGLHYSDLEQRLKTEISRSYKNFTLTANFGRLRSIQMVVVGNARYPGTYTLSSLSTLVNAVFASGGPTAQGSLRHFQLRRGAATIADFDLYDLLLKGDLSKDTRLQSGDVLYIPPVGPLAAISGSVNTPAIYEMKQDSRLEDLIAIAGNLSTVADTSKLTVERFVEHKSRTILEFPYDDQSRAFPLKDGDVVRVFSVSPRFEDTVTLRGSVANPGRYPWKAGMRVRDLIPDAQALLTRRYWLDRAAIVNGRFTQYPVPKPKNADGSPNADSTKASTSQKPGEKGPTDSAAAGPAVGALNSSADPDVPSEQVGGTSLSSRQRSQSSGANPNVARNVTEDLRRYAPEINWDYAIIQRVNPVDLSSKLLWMSPRKAILEHDDASNLELEPGDIVTIFSQRDISVPQTKRSQYVIVEGEVVRPGVYKLENNETLHSVLERAGGLTPEAYVYGSELIRESARAEQQASLETLASTMEVQIRQSSIALATASGVDAGQLGQLQASQEGIIAQLHNARASGRVSLPVKPRDKSLTDFPNMLLEDSDRLNIPHKPSTVSVVGNVYNAGSFIFDPRNTAGVYLALAGKGKPASDMHHAFVLRANGVVVAANNVNGLFTGGKFERLKVYPGDQIIVPYKLPTGSFLRGLRDFTQISSQLALTGAAVAVIKP